MHFLNFAGSLAPNERTFEHPVWWAAFYLTGA